MRLDLVVEREYIGEGLWRNGWPTAEDWMVFAMVALAFRRVGEARWDLFRALLRPATERDELKRRLPARPMGFPAVGPGAGGRRSRSGRPSRARTGCVRSKFSRQRNVHHGR